MRPLRRLLFVLALVSGAWATSARAQDESIVSIYRIAPGQHMAFLQFMADGEAAAQDAGVPAPQWYVHQRRQLRFALDRTGATDEHNEAVDAASRARGLKTGGQGAIEFRSFVAWHTDTFVGGPMTAAELLADAQSD